MLKVGRRGFIGGLIALVTAPAIVRAGSLMPVKMMPMESDLEKLYREMREHGHFGYTPIDRGESVRYEVVGYNQYNELVMESIYIPSTNILIVSGTRDISYEVAPKGTWPLRS